MITDLRRDVVCGINIMLKISDIAYNLVYSGGENENY